MKLQNFLLRFFYCFFLIPAAGFSQEKIKNIAIIDFELLNTYIVEEINILRDDADVPPISVENLLRAPAEDQVKYIANRQKLTSKQRNKYKKTPKNRVNFYGEHFEFVSEHLQQNNLEIEVKLRKDKHESKVDTYDRLAKLLVESWKKSREQFKLFIDPKFSSAYTSIVIHPDRTVYACLLLAPPAYFYPPEKTDTLYSFKPEKYRKCWRCITNPLDGNILIDSERNLYFVNGNKGISLRIAMFRRWSDGIAADIVLKDQYPCDDQNVFNGKAGVRGIPLQPVFKKDFRKENNDYNRKGIYIHLGKVPDWIDQDFEVNLTTINNKRTCSWTQFHIIPIDFDLNIQIPFKLDTLIEEIVQYENDTVYKRIPYLIANSDLEDSVIYPVMNYIQVHQAEITEIQINGYSSIDGFTEKNMRLQEKRAENIREHLIDIGIDSTAISVRTLENEVLFRKEIEGTPYEGLNNLSNQEIKDSLQNEAFLTELEPILKNHRYADLRVVLKQEKHLPYDAALTKKMLQKALDAKNIQKARSIQAIQYYLGKKGELSVADLEETIIPFEKHYKLVLLNKAVMKYLLDSINPSAKSNFSDELRALKTLDSNNIKINTYIQILVYQSKLVESHHSLKNYYKQLRKEKYINEKYRAKMLLMIAYTHDIKRFRGKRIIIAKRYLFKKAKSQIGTANLSVQETFDLAEYYLFFHDDKYAYYLTNTLIKKTNNPENLVFFLKLIHLSDVKLPRSTYLKFFERIKRLTGDQYCTYFNSPQLNFEILDDLELKEIYCEQCKDFVPKK